MSLVRSRGSALNLLQFEDRCTPALIVSDAVWDPTVPNTLPWAIAQANSPAYPGRDVIEFDFTAAGLGPTPRIKVLSPLTVTEAVFIIGANGNNFVTLSNQRAFEFTHSNPAPNQPFATESVIDRLAFDSCIAPALPANQNGGAIRVTGGTLELRTARFTNNVALSGGAVYVGHNATLVVDGVGAPPAEWNPLGIPRTTFVNNSSNFDGGAIETEGITILRRALFQQNNAGLDGGAVDVYQTGVLESPAGAQTKVEFWWNTAFRNGGGVNFNSAAVSKLNALEFTGNSAANGGGFNVSNGTVHVTGGSVNQNMAPNGQGVNIEAAAGSTATVHAVGVSFAGNLSAPGVLGLPARIGDNGILNTSGCVFNGFGLPEVVVGSNGQWNPDGTDTP